MTERRMTDQRLEAALRALAPVAAPNGLRDRLLDEAAATPQAGRLPGPLGILADPGRPTLERRLLLVATIGLVLAAVVSAAILAQQLRADPTDQLLQRAWTAMADPPAFVMNLETTEGRLHVLRSDGGGRVRLETIATDDPNSTDSYYIAEPGRIGHGDRTLQLWDEDPRADSPGLAEVWLPARIDLWQDSAGEAAWPPDPDCPVGRTRGRDHRRARRASPDLWRRRDRARCRDRIAAVGQLGRRRGRGHDPDGHPGPPHRPTRRRLRVRTIERRRHGPVGSGAGRVAGCDPDRSVRADAGGGRGARGSPPVHGADPRLAGCPGTLLPRWSTARSGWTPSAIGLPRPGRRNGSGDVARW